MMYVLSDYINLAMNNAVYDKLEDGTYSGRIPDCPGVVAFAETLRRCEEELRSTLEDWLFMGLRFGHQIPVIGTIDLNREPKHEPLEPL